MGKVIYRPLFGYNRGIHGQKPPARIIGWDVVDDVDEQGHGVTLATVGSRREARNIAHAINTQRRNTIALVRSNVALQRVTRNAYRKGWNAAEKALHA